MSGAPGRLLRPGLPAAGRGRVGCRACRAGPPGWRRAAARSRPCRRAGRHRASPERARPRAPDPVAADRLGAAARRRRPRSAGRLPGLDPQPRSSSERPDRAAPRCPPRHRCPDPAGAGPGPVPAARLRTACGIGLPARAARLRRLGLRGRAGRPRRPPRVRRRGPSARRSAPVPVRHRACPCAARHRLPAPGSSSNSLKCSHSAAASCTGSFGSAATMICGLLQSSQRQAEPTTSS